MKGRVRYLVIVFLISFIVFNIRGGYSMNQWSDEIVKKLTTYLQDYMPAWTEDQTQQMLRESESSGDYNVTFPTNKGKLAIKIMGETILVNGKDITGQLGSKITHGDYSPIIEDVENSNIAIGDKNVINANYQTLYDSLLNLQQDISSDEKITDKEKTNAKGKKGTATFLYLLKK